MQPGPDINDVKGIIFGLELAAEICDQNTRGRKSIQAERIRATMMKYKLKTEKEN